MAVTQTKSVPFPNTHTHTHTHSHTVPWPNLPSDQGFRVRLTSSGNSGERKWLCVELFGHTLNPL